MTKTATALDLRTGPQRTFLHLLVSTLVVSVINFTVWFAVTFWVYLETRSVFATGLIDLVSSGEIPQDSTVLYAHLGGQPALNAYASSFD